MREKNFWEHLRHELPEGTHATRIESECSPGFPDVHYTLQGVTGTIELKSTTGTRAKYPFRGDHGLRTSQLRWIKDECEAGGKVLLALGAYPDVFILHAGLYASDLSKMTLEDVRRVAEVFWTRGIARTPEQKEAFRRVVVEPV